MTKAPRKAAPKKAAPKARRSPAADELSGPALAQLPYEIRSLPPVASFDSRITSRPRSFSLALVSPN